MVNIAPKTSDGTTNPTSGTGNPDEIPSIKRLNYFTSQFLQAQDFVDEQAYHINRQRLHNQNLHTWGIVSGGLTVIAPVGSNQISVSPGVAIDSQGREIVLTTLQTFSLNSYPANATLYLTIQYDEQPTDPYQSQGINGNTRITEYAELQLRNTANLTLPTDGSVLLLATIALDGSSNVSSFDTQTNVRYASAAIAPGAINFLQLAPLVANGIFSNRIITSEIIFTQANLPNNTQQSVPGLTFFPKLTLMGGYSKWTPDHNAANETYSGSIFGFMNGTQQQCFGFGVTRLGQNSWLPDAAGSTALYLSKVLYNDVPNQQQSTLIIAASPNSNNNGMTLQLVQNIAQGKQPISNFEIHLWLLCLA